MKETTARIRERSASDLYFTNKSFYSIVSYLIKNFVKTQLGLKIGSLTYWRISYFRAFWLLQRVLGTRFKTKY